ncbi:MAG TPA: DUF4136 domain-containing protein [Steroidobacteraceae bacterium]|nr:DUF4136 domain-containing protein [Steroidobacteraceae bacterium]
MSSSTFLRRLALPAKLALASAVLAACASGPEVRADYDHAADFGEYRTYGFVSQSGASPLSRPEFKSLALQTLQSAAAREMESRGYRPSPTPDLLIDFNGKLEERIDIESTPGGMGPGWGYGGWYGAPWGGQDVRTRHYKVGTLIMDIVDREKRQSVYQGGVEGIVSRQMLRDPAASLTEAVARAFEGYPFVAGQSLPVVATRGR